jgi:nitrate/TMAO reductase-like tetraheme cytochrome c subunit
MERSLLPLKALSLCFICGLLLAPGTTGLAADKARATYVGTNKCKECHEEQFESYEKYSRKAHSFQSIKKMQSKLTSKEYQKCFECHTTGHGKPGGFVSESQTPNMKNAGCETCHGPGSLHVASEDPKDIKSKLTADDCMTCHNEERVGSFKYRPLIYGGGH